MLNIKNWQDNKSEFLDAGVQLPSYDVNELKAAGKKHPVWLHIGAGNLYRTFHAEITDNLLDAGLLNAGIIAANMRSPFVIDNVYAPYNNDILMVTMCVDGSFKKRILSSTADALFASPERAEHWNKMIEYFQDSALQMVTYSITEKGYALKDTTGQLTDIAKSDIENGPDAPLTAMGRTCALLLARFNAGAAPIAMVTTDNFSQNGKHFRDSVLEISQGWLNNGFVKQDFIDYVSDEKQVSFPWSMIDRITPNPSDEVLSLLQEQGFEDIDIVSTSGGTGFSAFANTEETNYLVIEDSFPNGRPALDKAGVILCDRKTAELADTMKVTACLNPLHTCLAIMGCLFGYKRIWQEMQDQDLVALIKHLAYDEDLPVVQDPKVISPEKFVEELLYKRLPNKSLPDTPQRIACDTSQKVPIRYGHTLNSYNNAVDKNPADLTYIPLVIAGWMRYLMAVDDQGNKFELSSDPLLEMLQNSVSDIKLGNVDDVQIHNCLQPILSNREIFTCDLYEFGLGEKIELMFAEMLTGPGAVRETIRKYI